MPLFPILRCNAIRLFFSGLMVALLLALAAPQARAEEQTVRKAAILKRLRGLEEKYSAYKFSKWIKLGNWQVFSKRMRGDKFDVLVKPWMVKHMDATAAYVPTGSAYFKDYEQDLVLEFEPSSTKVPAILLWHEMVHAIFHGWELAGTPIGGNDHLYIGWAESSIAALPFLVKFEDYLAAAGKDMTDEEAVRLRRAWNNFEKRCGESNYKKEFGLPTPAQKRVLATRLGFDIDPQKIKTQYLASGVPRKAFEDDSRVKFMDLPCCQYWLEKKDGKSYVAGHYFNRAGKKIEYRSGPLHPGTMIDPNKGLMATSKGVGFHVYFVADGSKNIDHSTFVVVRLGDTAKEIHRVKIGLRYTFSQTGNFSAYTIDHDTPGDRTVRHLVLQ